MDDYPCENWLRPLPTLSRVEWETARLALRFGKRFESKGGLLGRLVQMMCNRRPNHPRSSTKSTTAFSDEEKSNLVNWGL